MVRPRCSSGGDVGLDHAPAVARRPAGALAARGSGTPRGDRSPGRCSAPSALRPRATPAESRSGPRWSLAKAVTGVSPSSTTWRVTGTIPPPGRALRGEARRSRRSLRAPPPGRSRPRAAAPGGCPAPDGWRGAGRPGRPPGDLADRERPLVGDVGAVHRARPAGAEKYRAYLNVTVAPSPNGQAGDDVQPVDAGARPHLDPHRRARCPRKARGGKARARRTRCSRAARAGGR